MIKHTLALALTLGAVALPSVASATTVVESLDTNSSWTVRNVTLNGTATPAVVPAVVPTIYVGGGAAAPGGQLNTATNGAFWIYPTAAGNHPQNNTFAFAKVFTLSGATNLASALLSGNYWSDNGIVSILLNGNAIFGPVGEAAAGSAPITTFSSGTGTSIASGAGKFVYGTNTLVFNVRNGNGGSGNPVALLGDLQVAAAVPEPGTWLLMLLGFGAIGFAMRSRAKTQVRFQFA